MVRNSVKVLIEAISVMIIESVVVIRTGDAATVSTTRIVLFSVTVGPSSMIVLLNALGIQYS